VCVCVCGLLYFNFVQLEFYSSALFCKFQQLVADVLQMVFISQSPSRVIRRPDGSIPTSYLPPPPRSKLPMTLLSKDPHFACLFNLLRQLSSFCPSSVSAVRIILKHYFLPLCFIVCKV